MDPLTIVSRTLSPAMATQPYEFQLQALGGVPPYAWTIVSGFGAPPTGVLLVGDLLKALAGAIPETEVGTHGFRIRVTDSDTIPATDTLDVTMAVRPYGFTRAHEFVLDPQLFDLIQKYLVGSVTREKVEMHFFRDISTALGENFQHVARDVLVEDWTGLYPFHTAADEGLRDVLDSVANDLLYFANPIKYTVSSVTPGPGALQGNFALASTTGLFVGRSGETDNLMARQWFRLVDPTTDDEPHDGDGNPLVVVHLEDADGVEINPNLRPYQVDAAGFHTGRNSGGTFIGYTLTLVVEYVPNPHSKSPVVPFAVRYGEREELHDMSPEAFIKFGNVLGEVDADVIALIKTAPFAGFFRVGTDVVVPIDQQIELQGQNGLDIETNIGEGLIRLVAPDSLRTINGVPPAGAGDFVLEDGEFIEIESSVDDKRVTVKAVIPVHSAGDTPVGKALVSGEDYGKFLQLVGTRLIRMHQHRGEDLYLGAPPDGSFQDGYIPLDPDATVAETLDRLNEQLGIALGQTVQDLADASLVEVTGISRDRGYLANDGAITYEGAWPAGSEAPYAYNDSTNIAGSVAMEFETAVEFGPVTGGVGQDTLEILVNGAVLELWNPLPGPIVPGPSPLGYMDIVSVRVVGANTIIKLKGLLDPSDVAVSALLVRGYNYFQLRHTVPGPTAYTSASFKAFLDATAPSVGGFALPTTVYGDAPGKEVWLSGILHYAGDNELLVSFSANGTFRDTYYQTPYEVQVNSPKGWQSPASLRLDDPSVSGVSSPPASADNVTVADFPTGQPIKDYSVEQSAPQAYLRLIHKRPTLAPTVLSQTSLLLTASGETVLYALDPAGTTDKIETFEDERYRLNPNDPRWPNYTQFPVMRRQTFGWDSTKKLYIGVTPFGDGGGDPGTLQVNPKVGHGAGVTDPAEGALTWPVLNYNTGSYKPAQPTARDYGIDFAGTTVATYDRAFVFKDEPRSHGKFRIVGITSAQIGLSYLGSGGAPTGDVNLELKLPGSRTNYHSGWMDLAKLAMGTFNDGDGCRVGSIVDVVLASGENAVEIEWTGNGLSTVDTGEMAILRVTYRATTPVIFRIEEIG